MAELWDLYDEKRKPLGRTVERGQQNGCAAYHLVVFVLVRNSSGQFLITKRHPNKHLGGKWEFTAGSALAGETSLQAALRETREETGIDHTDSAKRFLIGKVTRWRDGPKRWHGDFDDLWLFEKDFDLKDVTLQESETVDVRWVTKEELYGLVREKQFSTSIALDQIDSL